MKIGTISHLRPNQGAETKPSAYDRTSAAVASGIVLTGFLFTVLIAIWMTTEFDFSKRSVGPEPVTPMDDTPPKGQSDDILEPGVQEFPEVSVPQLAPALLAVTDVVSTVKASPDNRTGSDPKTGLGLGLGHRDGDKTLGTDGTPAYKRWTINYQAEDLETYADQLSFFEIDLGAVHETKNDIWRVSDPGGAAKIIDSNRGKENKTLRFQQTKQRMRKWDKQLCIRAGIDTTSTVLCQFYPEGTKATIQQVEAAAIAKAGRELKEVRRTTFKIVPDGDGFKFEVVEILYH